MLSFCGRHCLWILGNETTLINSKSIWAKLVQDAKDRGCCYNANEDKNLADAIIKAAVELDELDNLLNMDTLHVSRTSWKVFCFLTLHRHQCLRVMSYNIVIGLKL